MNEQKNSTEQVSIAAPRRNFVSWLWKLLAAAACIEAGWVTTSIFSARRKKSEAGSSQGGLVDVGVVTDFSPGDVKAVPQGQFYLSCLEDGSFIALSRRCTHLGCTVPWNGERKMFVCPCHGSTFDGRGLVLSAPALRPLDYYPVRIENGLIRVDASKAKKREEFSASQTARA